MLRGEKFTAGFARVGRIAGDKEFIGITEQIDLVIREIPKIQTGHAVQHSGKACVFVSYRIAKPVAGGVKVSE